MPDAEVIVEPPQQLAAEPVSNKLGGLEPLNYRFGNVTRPSLYRRGEVPIHRPLFLRVSRARLYRRLRHAARRKRAALLAEAHLRDAVARQYLAQGTVRVRFPDWGEQAARYVRMQPPAYSGSSAKSDEAPIVLIPGISNDLDCVGSLLQEFPLRGRTVLAIAHPESILGRVSAAFAEAVAHDPAYGPHAAFFSRAVRGLCPAGTDFELWGLSTGAAVVEQMLLDPTLQQRTTRAVLMCPASTVALSEVAMRWGIVQEMALLFLRFRSVANWTVTERDRESSEEPEQRRLKEAVFKSIYTRVRRPLGCWRSMRTRGGQILVLSGSLDAVTRSFRVFNSRPRTVAYLRRQNPQIEVVALKFGSHGTPLTQPGPVVERLLRRHGAG